MPLRRLDVFCSAAAVFANAPFPRVKNPGRAANFGGKAVKVQCGSVKLILFHDSLQCVYFLFQLEVMLHFEPSLLFASLSLLSSLPLL